MAEPESRDESAAETTEDAVAETESEEEVSLEDAVAKAIEEVTSTEDQAEEEEETEEETAPIEALEHWPDDFKAKFAELDDAAKQILIDREKTLQSSFDKQEDGELRQRYETFESTVKPFEPYLAARNLTAEQAFQALIGAQMALERDFVPAIEQIISRMGHEPKTVIQALAKRHDIVLDDHVFAEDETTKALNEKITSLETKIQQRDTATQQASQAQINQMIADFRDAKDGETLLHPHFEAVKGKMSALLGSGEAKGLDEAYDLAIHADPKIREDLKKAELEEALKQEREKRDEEAKKALEAASPEPKPKGRVDKEPMFEKLDDAVDYAMKQVAARK